MNWSSGLSWLSALKDWQLPAFVETDRADMGTAFGLDASLEAPAEGDAEAFPPVSTPLESRLIRRSGL